MMNALTMTKRTARGLRDEWPDEPRPYLYGSIFAAWAVFLFSLIDNPINWHWYPPARWVSLGYGVFATTVYAWSVRRDGEATDDKDNSIPSRGDPL